MVSIRVRINAPANEGVPKVIRGVLRLLRGERRWVHAGLVKANRKTVRAKLDDGNEIVRRYVDVKH